MNQHYKNDISNSESTFQVSQYENQTDLKNQTSRTMFQDHNNFSDFQTNSIPRESNESKEECNTILFISKVNDLRIRVQPSPRISRLLKDLVKEIISPFNNHSELYSFSNFSEWEIIKIQIQSRVNLCVIQEEPVNLRVSDIDELQEMDILDCYNLAAIENFEVKDISTTN